MNYRMKIRPQIGLFYEILVVSACTVQANKTTSTANLPRLCLHA